MSPLTPDDVVSAVGPPMAHYEVEIDCWNAENWLTYHGDQRESVGKLMGPTMAGEPCTVVAAVSEAGYAWADDRRGRTLLGLVTGDVRAEMGTQVRTSADGVDVVLVEQRGFFA